MKLGVQVQGIFLLCVLVLGSQIIFVSLGDFSIPLEKNDDNGSILKTESMYEYLIITSESFLPVLQPLAIWKQQRGLSTAIKTLEEINENYEGHDRPEAIRNCIIDYYQHHNLQWVLLAGNKNIVPTRSVRIDSDNVVCDQYYANLDDNWLLNTDGSVSSLNSLDWNTDVYIGRLPAENSAQMTVLVDRLINYEKTPLIGSWMNHAIFAGAFANFNVDVNNNSILDEEDWLEFDANRCHNWIKANILPADWNSTLLGEAEGLKTSDYYYDMPLNEANLIATIQGGVGIGMFDAHGSTTGMGRLIFTNDADGDSLLDFGTDSYTSVEFINTNSDISSNKSGFYFLCACGTGNFDYNGVGLAEHLLYSCSIGCIASSRSAYYEGDWYERSHGGWATQGLSARFWQQLFSECNQPGKAFTQAKLAYVDDCLKYNESEDLHNKTLTQYNLLGDPEVSIWMTIPSPLDAEISFDDSQTTVKAVSEDQALANVTVTLTNSTYYWKGLTDNNGYIVLPLLEKELKTVALTLSKKDYTPYQQPSEVPFTSFTGYVNSSSSTEPLQTSFPIQPVIFVIVALSLIVHRQKRKNPNRSNS